MTRAQRRAVLLAPLGIWLVLLALLGGTLLYAQTPGLPMKPVAAIGFGAAQGLLIVTFFMALRRAAVLVRLAAAAGLAWLCFLYLFSFADYLTR